MPSGSVHVSALSVLFMFITVLVCLGLPIGLAAWMKARHRRAFSFVPLLAGILAFFVSQVVIRQPLFQVVLPLFGWYRQFMQMHWPYAVFLSLTAGLVEEPARFIAFSIMKKRHSFIDGVSYGIGHGGIEAILVVGLSYVGNIIFSLMLNASVPGASGPPVPPQVVSGLTSLPSFVFLVAGLERIFAISMQIALSLLVLRGFQTNRKAFYLIFAILLHGLANFLAQVATQVGTSLLPGSPLLGGVLFAEGLLLVIAVLSVLYIARRARDWRGGPANQAPPDPAGQV